MKRIPFTNHKILLEKRDALYIFSDGYTEQLGDPAGKKFKYSGLKDLLLSVQIFPVDMQQIQIRETIRIWKGEFEQVDDICVFGLQI